MQNIIIMGAGKMGSLIAHLLAYADSYHVYLADINQPSQQDPMPHLTFVQLDATQSAEIKRFIQEHHITAIISSLPYYCNLPLAKIASETNTAYFDLTEDVATKRGIMQLAQDKHCAYVPQCGLAPGFVNIVAHDLMKRLDEVDTVKLRVGALPEHSDNALHYALTWSTEGLINEYGNPCQAIENGELVQTKPLEGLEALIIDGVSYEAFNTSGGIGSLVETYVNKVKRLDYKSIRYHGHCEKIKFLMNDLKLNQERELLKDIFETAMPITLQDMMIKDIVILYIGVSGIKEKQYKKIQYVKKYYPKSLPEKTGLQKTWSAIQLTTALSCCAVFDTVMQNQADYHGYIKQEAFTLQDILNNRYGDYLGAADDK